MKTCPTCGTSATDETRVCEHCGNPFPIDSVREDARVVQLRERRERKEREEARRYWQQQRRQNQARRARSSAWSYWSASPATIVLMALTVVFTLGYGLIPPTSNLVVGLILSLFVSGGLIGLLFSLFFLYFVGGYLERAVPLALYLIVFFGSGLIGGFVELRLLGSVSGIGAALWGMVGALYMWGRLGRFGGMPMQWLTGTIVITLALNLLMFNFNIGQLLAQIVLALLVGAAIVWAWTQIPGTRRMR